ncbi:uncharacterized protein FMAN_08551 [Fusarium mangiferae]|uniref:CCHC-type domain-containing protein n=1 Tax=Fusarium mangiferae TaxID=192010 RepID=A0A1L7TTP1_FUSMA|nr:uncharacterized protein FMAN_08551 [Fusarium mangiferae]CVK98611.1 uncharacterized protein FMAN_08551 [Fusarium mangiferae]
MSSDLVQSAVSGGESYISPTTNLQPDSPEYEKVEAMMGRIMDFMCQQFRNMNDRLSELKIEVGEISGSKTMLALDRINERLSHFDDINARFNEAGMLDHGKIRALDVFNGRLFSIEEDIKCLKHAIQGAADDSDDSIKRYLGKVDDRLSNLESNLHRLEDRMFANLDGAIDDETGFITVVMDALDFQKLDAMNPTEIAQKLREKGSGWKIESIKLKAPKTADQQHQVIINFLTRESEAYMRQHISEMSELFGLEHGVYCLSPVYTMHVEHLVPHLSKGGMGHKELEEALLKALDVKGIKAKVTYERMLLKTQDFDLVSRLCFTGVTLLGHYYEIVPFCVQGTPLFCYRCWKTGHFKDDCTVSVMLCGRCSGAHDTRGCKAASRCCNCNGPHVTWSLECTISLSREEHRASAWYRQLVPHWAKHLPKTGKPILPTVTKTKPAKAKANPAESSPTKSGEQSGASSSKAAEKRPVGRPKALPSKEPGQQTLGHFLKTGVIGSSPAASTEPSSSPDADMTGTDTVPLPPSEGTGVQSPDTQSSTADASSSSVSDVDNSLTAMEMDTDTNTTSSSTPSASQSSGSDGDSGAADMDIDTVSTADNGPVEAETPGSEPSKPSSSTKAKSDPKGGKQGSNNSNKNSNKNGNKNSKNSKNTNKNNNKDKNNSTAKQTTTQTSTPSLVPDPSQQETGNQPGGASENRKRFSWKEFKALKKARKQANKSASVNNTPAPVSDAPVTDVPATDAPVVSSTTPLDSGIISTPIPPAGATSAPATPLPAVSVPAVSVPDASVPATSAPPPLPPIPTASTPSNSVPTASLPSTINGPSTPMFPTFSNLLPPPPVVGIAQPSGFNFEEISQPVSPSGKPARAAVASEEAAAAVASLPALAPLPAAVPSSSPPSSTPPGSMGQLFQLLQQNFGDARTMEAPKHLLSVPAASSTATSNESLAGGSGALPGPSSSPDDPPRAPHTGRKSLVIDWTSDEDAKPSSRRPRSSAVPPPSSAASSSTNSTTTEPHIRTVRLAQSSDQARSAKRARRTSGDLTFVSNAAEINDRFVNIQPALDRLSEIFMRGNAVIITEDRISARKTMKSALILS